MSLHEAVKAMGFDADIQSNKMNDALNYGSQVLKEMDSKNKIVDAERNIL